MHMSSFKDFIFKATCAILGLEARLASAEELKKFGPESFASLMQSIARLATQIGLPIAALFLVWSGFLFVSARGDAKKLETAKSTFYWSVIGPALLVGASAIATALVDFAKKL